MEAILGLRSSPESPPMAREAAEEFVEFLMDSDEEMEEEQPQPRRGRGGPGARLPLHQFLRLIAGGRLVDPGGAAGTNEQLLQNLRRGGVVQSDGVTRALRICARDLFVPEPYREEAFVDAPIRVEEHDFNISAPHMHATCLEVLALQPGHAFLDVGSGCGVLTACGALLVGRQGVSVGVDIRRECLAMSRDAVGRLAAGNDEFAATAALPRFELANVFMPPPHLLGAWDRVHVGASCPPDRVQFLLQLLKPSGGIIIVPVAPNDLRLITRKPNGAVTQRIVSQVRFSELEVPTDSEVLLTSVRSMRRQRTIAPRVPSTYAEDMTAITTELPPSPFDARSMPRADSSCFVPSSSPCTVFEGLPPTPRESERSWPHRLSRFLSSCSGAAPSSSPSTSGLWGEDCPGGEGSACSPFISSSSSDQLSSAEWSAPPAGARLSLPASPLAGRLSLASLGPPDCALVGGGGAWEVPVHWAVLRQRCDHFRARCDSGMRDARAQRCSVPDHFSREAVEALVRYAYTDQIDKSMDPQAAVGLLHVAQFYGCTRLAHLCEVLLGRLLKPGRHGGDAEEGLADAAATLLALAEEHGLTHLRSVALDYCVHHWESVRRTEAGQALSRQQVELVASEACAAYQGVLAQLRDLHATQCTQLPEPSY